MLSGWSIKKECRVSGEKMPPLASAVSTRQYRPGLDHRILQGFSPGDISVIVTMDCINYCQEDNAIGYISHGDTYQQPHTLLYGLY
jgi:hypothetical protein